MTKAILILALVMAFIGCAVARASDKVAAEGTGNTAPATPGLLHIPIHADGLVGVLVLPDAKGTYPGILRLGGAEGGANTRDADIIASRGYAVLALAYFGAEGLPADLEEIPLEYFEKAIAWMKHNANIDPEHLGIIGVSRGSSLALLLPTIYHDFDAVVALAPTHVVWQSSYLDWSRYAEKSSLSFRGKPLPFVPYDFSDEAASAGCNQSGNCAAMYDYSLGQIDRVNASVIAVERITAPILLVSGEADALWPANKMGNLVVQRLAEKKFRYEIRHISHANAGHCAMSDCFGGGTPTGNKDAVEEISREVVTFLDRYLKQNAEGTRKKP